MEPGKSNYTGRPEGVQGGGLQELNDCEQELGILDDLTFPAILVNLCPSRPVRLEDRPDDINQHGIMHLTVAAVLCCGFCTARPVQLSTLGQEWS